MGDQFGFDKALFLLLSWAISILSSYTMFLLVSNFRKNDGSSNRNWLIGGSVVFGFGASAMHIMTMLAWDYMVVLNWVTALAGAFSSAVTFLAFYVIGSSCRVVLRLPLSSLLLSLAACGLCYVNLMGGPVSRIEINAGLFTVSIIVSLVGSAASIYLFERKPAHYKWMSGMLFSCSNIAMVLFGMEAVTAEYSEVMTTDRLNETLMLMMGIIGFGTLLVLCFSHITWIVSKRFDQMDERYKLLVENSMDMIAIFSQDQWEYINKSGIRMFEAESEADLLGKSIYDFIDPIHHETVKKRLLALKPDEGNAPIEQEWYTVRGNLLYTEVVETATTMTGKPAVQVIIRDISERKKNEELLINSEKLYVAGQLAAGIAHEIRNPLTSLKGFLQLLSSGRAAGKNYFGIMKSELTRIESIVSELLMLSKPQMYELSYGDARMIVNDTVTLMAAQAIMNNIEMEMDFDESPLWLYGVENQIKQVFINVLKNAVEAMPAGGTIHIHSLRQGNDVVVRIIDQGPGIDEEQLSKMGQPFYTTKEKGTGLGLMVSYKIVDNHHGHISAASEVGMGTTVEIVLPYLEPSDNALTKERREKVTNLGQFRTEKGDMGIL